jgi:hypothetical protein
MKKVLVLVLYSFLYIKINDYSLLIRLISYKSGSKIIIWQANTP